MSDHISGPRALADPVADITDVYAFPSPERGDRLVLVMNTLPMAKPSDLFSEGLLYRFRLRALNRPRANGGTWQFVPGDEEYVLSCVFSSPDPAAQSPTQEGTCTSPTGESVSFRVNDPGGRHRDRHPCLRRYSPGPVHHGRACGADDVATTSWRFTDPGSIFLDGKSVLTSLVIEVDSAVLGGTDLVGVVAETLTRGSFNVRIERVGRPEVKNMMLAPKEFDPVNRDLEIRDLYNMEDAFHLGDSYQGAYRARLNANLAFWDGLDGTADWRTDENGNHPSPTSSWPTSSSSTSPSPTSSTARSSRSNLQRGRAARTRPAEAARRTTT